MDIIQLPKYHWTADVPDFRDIDYQRTLGEHVPRYVDLRGQCSDVEQQATLGSCTGQAIVGHLEILENKDLLSPFVDLSRLFVYYNERELEGTVLKDAGARIRDGIKSIYLTGVCLESLWPYDITLFKLKPPPRCYEDAAKRKISAYYRLNGLPDMLDCLGNGYPFVFGFAVYESFESQEVARTGIMPMPGARERCLGGHAILAVGYDLVKRVFIIRNSWGKEWGMDGYFLMPFDYADNIKLSADFWTVRK